MLEYLKSLKEQIELLKGDIEEIEEYTEPKYDGDYFNPQDASGGNFDDCYQMGFEHGEKYAKLEALQDNLNILEGLM